MGWLVQSWWGYNVQVASLYAQESAYQGEMFASHARKMGFEGKSKFDNSDIDFKRRRTEIARKLASLKVRLATTPGAAYNYGEMISAIQQRVVRDLRDAIARTKVAVIGMLDIYGYQVPLPQSVLDSDKISVGYAPVLDDAYIWVRDALSWLSRFAQNEQSYAMAFSVRSLVGEQKWQKGMRAGVWEFELSPNHFASQRMIRLRGFSANVVGGKLWERGI